MENFKDIQIGDILVQWDYEERISYCVVAKKTKIINEKEITTLKVVKSFNNNLMRICTIDDCFGQARYYELKEHNDLSL